MMTRWLKGLLILPWLGIVTLPLQGFGYEAMPVTDGGTIVGEVKYAGDPPPPEKIDVTKDANICGAEPKTFPCIGGRSEQGHQGCGGITSRDSKRQSSRRNQTNLQYWIKRTVSITRMHRSSPSVPHWRLPIAMMCSTM